MFGEVLLAAARAKAVCPVFTVANDTNTIRPIERRRQEEAPQVVAAAAVVVGAAAGYNTHLALVFDGKVEISLWFSYRDTTRWLASEVSPW